ncbi:MAG: ABC-2 family transporter protein, partial [Lachnospiraceae bacterium]
MKTIRLYLHYVSINIRCMMQYKTSFLLTVVGQFLVSFNIFLGIFFMFQRFSSVEGFTYSEVLLCFSVVLLEFGLAEMVARGFDTFSGMVRSGEFDRVLVRPQNEIC